MLRKLRIGLGLFILAVSILFLAWGFWPVQRELRVRPVSGTPGSAGPEKRGLTLLYPPKIRAGDTGVVRLTLDVDALKDIFPATRDRGSTHFYDTYTIIAEARFDLPGMSVRPSDLISAPVAQGQTAVFYWTLRPVEAGHVRGTIWLYLRTVDKQTGEESRETISAQIVEIESVKFIGLLANRARAIGLVGVVIGLFLSLPFFGALARIFILKRSEIS
jgi:hypothetical protein